MKDDLTKIILMKIEVKLAFDAFSKKYPKVSKGIKKIYEEIMLTNELNKINSLYSRFFGYILKSKRAKERKEEFEE